ncbi:hypothetical protein DF18_35585, partial [Streptomyces rimosus]
MSTPRAAGLGLLGLACLFAVAEAVPRLGLIDPRHLPPATAIVRRLVTELGDAALWTALGETLRSWAIGLALACCLAVALGVLIDAV